MVRRLRDVLLLAEFPDRLPAVHLPQHPPLLFRTVSFPFHRLVLSSAQTLSPPGSLWRGHLSSI